MKWRIGLGLVALGAVLGLSPLAGLGDNYVPATPDSLVAAQADNAITESYSGIIGTGDTQVPWTIKDGTLTLTGGTLRPFADGWKNLSKGQLITDLVEDNLDGLTLNDLQTMVTHIDISKKTIINNNASYLFANFPNVTSYTNLNNLDVSTVNDSGLMYTGLSYMFAQNTALQTFTAPCFSDTNAHSMMGMFTGDTNLVYLDLSQADTRSVTSITNLAYTSPLLQVLNLGNFNSNQVNTDGYTALISPRAPINNLTLSPQINLSTTSLYSPNTDTQVITGNWQEVGSGKVDFNSQGPFPSNINDFKNNYRNYDPNGEVLDNPDYTSSTAQLLSLYDGTDHGIQKNKTYVWELLPGGNFTTPDPVIPTPTPTPAPDTTTTEEDQADFQPFSVSATQRIGLYSSKNFTAANRMTWYAQKPQMKQPTFLVTGTTTTKNGTARYQVRDTSRNASTYGQTGYITTSADAVTPTYYQDTPQTVTVINPTGINGYNNAALTRPITTYPQGKQLKVTAVVTKDLTTRFQLANGTYISANKQLVITGKYAVPAKVQAKTAVNRYGTVNLTQKNKHYRQKTHQVFTVLGWDYSRGASTTTTGTLRYRVAGGYITANSKYVTRVK